MHPNHNNEPMWNSTDHAQHRVDAQLQREADKALLETIEKRVTELESVLAHYKHLLETAIIELRDNGDCPYSATCPYIWKFDSDPPYGLCNKCWFYYLEALVKEEEKNHE